MEVALGSYDSTIQFSKTNAEGSKKGCKIRPLNFAFISV